MQLTPVDSSALDSLKDFHQLTDVALRSSYEPGAGVYIAESLKILERALRARHDLVSVLTTEKWIPQLTELERKFPNSFASAPVYVGSSEALEKTTGFHVHRGTLASMRRPPLPSVEEVVAGAQRVVVLDDIVDHTNVGAIFRSVAGIGADAVIVSASCADPLYRRSVRVSMGTVLQVPWTRADTWASLREILRAQGFNILAFALAESAVSLAEFTPSSVGKAALVFGSEGDGLSATILKDADHVVTIPMKLGVDSLNVAAASAVAMWALRVTENS